jgi:hypothetical protein
MGAVSERTLRIVLYGAAALGIVLCLGVVPYSLLRHRFSFDDAYMFFRYALNLRQGLGVSWNPDGVPTYGLTSQLWVFLVLPFTYLPVRGDIGLQLASWATGAVALVLLAYTVLRHSGSRYLTQPAAAFALVALPLLLSSRFVYHLTTGMDTMLALLANTLLILAVLNYVQAPSRARAVLMACIGVIAVLSRPENGLCAGAVPLLAWLLCVGWKRWLDAAAFCATLGILLAADLFLCDRYFGVALPLSFFAKSMHSYAGFMSTENALQYLFTASLCMVPFLALLCVNLKRRMLAIAVAMLLPALLTFAYLLTVRQVMGFVGRYYIPFLPFFIVPAALAFDAGLVIDGARAVRRSAIAVVLGVVLFAVSVPLQNMTSRAYLARIMPVPVPVPTLVVDAPRALPTLEWFDTIRQISDLVATLPPQTVVAASEVGYLGYASQSKTVIDLVGLNDTDIGAHGFTVQKMLARKPDLIWLPHGDYTGLLAKIYSDPAFFAAYDVYAGAFNYGIAIRRDAPLRSEIYAQLKSVWSALYHDAPLEQYLVRATR